MFFLFLIIILLISFHSLNNLEEVEEGIKMEVDGVELVILINLNVNCVVRLDTLFLVVINSLIQIINLNFRGLILNLIDHLIDHQHFHNLVNHSYRPFLLLVLYQIIMYSLHPHLLSL